MEVFGSPEAMKALTHFGKIMADDIIPALVTFFEVLYETGILDAFITSMGVLGDAFKLMDTSGLLKWMADSTLIGQVTNLINNITTLKDDLIGLPGKVKDKLFGLFDPLYDGFLNIYNKIIGLWDSLPSWDDVNPFGGIDITGLVVEAKAKAAAANSANTAASSKSAATGTWSAGSWFKGLQGNALGGSFQGLSLVGERGPELIHSGNRTTSVFNNSDSRSMMRSGSGLTTSDLEAIVDRMIERIKPDVNMQNVFNEKVDSNAVARDVSWSLDPRNSRAA